MITDRETNFVYFSSLLKEKPELSAFWLKLECVLKKEGIGYGFIQNTKDIWCRDYMPIQVARKEFMQFTFDPYYLKEKKYRHKHTDTDQVTISPLLDATINKAELVLDGGNVVRSKNTVVLTDYVFKDNDLTQDEFIYKLKQALKVEHVHLLPKQPCDFTGHSDGMVRLLDNETLLVAGYEYESSSWKARYKKALELTGLQLIDFPSVASDLKNSEGDYTALGCYINFACIGKVILFPQFDLPEDASALREARSILKGYKLVPVPAAEIAIDGGVLNCITWNVQI